MTPGCPSSQLPGGDGMARMVRKALSCDTMAAAMSPPTAMPSSSSSAMVATFAQYVNLFSCSAHVPARLMRCPTVGRLTFSELSHSTSYLKPIAPARAGRLESQKQMGSCRQLRKSCAAPPTGTSMAGRAGLQAARAVDSTQSCRCQATTASAHAVSLTGRESRQYHAVCQLAQLRAQCS